MFLSTLLLSGCIGVSVITVDVVTVKDNEVIIELPKDLVIYQCVKEISDANRVLRKITNSRGQTLVIKGVQCNSA